jgi:hypothetical protein
MSTIDFDSISKHEEVKTAIRQAFASVEYPGDWCLRGSNDGDEPYLLAEEFKCKTDWQSLDAGFIDQAPAGYGTALCFFSDEAFRFYLPAYLIADIDGQLQQHDPSFHLTHGLSDQTRNELINSRRYGERTWFELRRYKFSMFSSLEVKAIVAYLKWCSDTDECSRETIDQALTNYWNRRMAGHDD